MLNPVLVPKNEVSSESIWKIEMEKLKTTQKIGFEKIAFGMKGKVQRF